MHASVISLSSMVPGAAFNAPFNENRRTHADGGRQRTADRFSDWRQRTRQTPDVEQVDDRDQPVAERCTDGRTHDIQRRIADEKIVAEHFDNRACKHRDKRQVNSAERLLRRVGDSHKCRRRYGKAEQTHQHTAKLRALRVQHAQDRA